MKPYTKRLIARNLLQIFGENKETPSSFVVCWTPDGKDSGGTGYAIRAAQKAGIPVYNLKNESDRERFKKEIILKGKNND